MMINYLMKFHSDVNLLISQVSIYKIIQNVYEQKL